MVSLQILLVLTPGRVGDRVIDEVENPGSTHGRLITHPAPCAPQSVIFSVLVQVWRW